MWDIGLVKGLKVGVTFVTSYVYSLLNVRDSLPLSKWILILLITSCGVTTLK